jgi:hypothetical protein
VVAEVRIVDRRDLRDLGEHPQQPGAAASGRAEDPRQAVVPLGERELALGLPVSLDASHGDARLSVTGGLKLAVRTPSASMPACVPRMSRAG